MRPLLTPQLSRAKKRFCPCADSMLVKLDENLGRSHVALLLEAGHQADRVHDQGLSRRGLIRLSGSVFLAKDGSSSPWTWALPMFDGTSPGLIPGSCSCAHAIGAGRPSFRFWNAS